MDRTKIKEHIINTLKNTFGEKYNITGDYPQKFESIAIVISIAGENQILGRGNGRLSYDFITSKEKTMYVTTLAIRVSVYSPIDEEASSICGDIQNSIRAHIHDYMSRINGITAVHDVSGITTPSIVTGGEKKTWASSLNFNITITEIIES